MPDYRADLALSHNNLGNLLRAAGRPKEAETTLRDAIALQQRLAADFPASPGYRANLARCHNNLGILFSDAGRPREAEAAWRDAIALQQRLAADFPAMPDYQNELAGTLGNLSSLCCDRREFAEGRRLLEEALPHHTAALRANPRDPSYRKFFRNNLATLAPTLAALGDHAAAVRRADEIAGLGFDPVSDPYDAACALSLCVPHAAGDAKLTEARRSELAAEYCARAVAYLHQAVQKGFGDIPHLLKDTDFDPIRRRADFAEFLWDLAESAPPAPKPADPR
jgi:tetratricopeptide (TPR) repeat protein